MSSSGDRVDIRPARWPWIALAVFFCFAIVGTIVVVVNGESVAAQVPFIIAFTMFGIVGALIVSRDRGNTIGLMLLYGGVMTSSSFLGGELTTFLVTRGHTGPFVVALALMNNFGWLLGILPIVFLLPLVFPDGHLPSPRWRPFLWFIVIFLSLIGVSFIIGQRILSGSNQNVGIPNPFFVEATSHIPNLDVAIAVLFPAIFLVSVSSLFLRFRRATGIERQQIKWVVFGLAFAFVTIIVGGFVTQPEVPAAVVSGAGFLAFPLSIGIAVLRFHLYDLDVVVRKTVIYATLALFATIVYLALVVGLGAWLGQGSSFLTMVAAVIVAVTFQPVRSWVTRLSNRVVYGERATPYEVLAEFSERVGEAYAEQDVLPRMARVLGEGVGAERADVWLAVDRELRDVAAWPSEAESLAPIAIENGELPAVDGADRIYAVRDAGELLGALAVRKPASDPISPGDERLVADLAGQAGLMLRNARLTEELKRRLEDLKAAQKRLVSAQDEARRRLERNIHDGAQQQLVALAVKLKLADDLVDRDAVKAHTLLDQLQGETHAALEDLRDLARGIYPPLLADRGLGAALESQSRKVPIPVRVDADGVGRFPQDVEAAVYFSCLEALQNVAKYAQASAAIVELRVDPPWLRFSVADDGCGFDVSAVFGSGLQGVTDRLAAIGGALNVNSSPGSGTTVMGQVPVALDTPEGAERRARTA